VNPRSSCAIQDPVLERTLIVEKENSSTTVVWNPWVNKARAMADFGDEEWPDMICVETANVGEGALQLGAGQAHRMKMGLRISE